MKQYTEKDIEKLLNEIQLSNEVLVEALNWTENNLKHEEKNNLVLSIKNSLNIINKVTLNVNSKPVIAVFGGSQVGKSYLIKNLLSNEGGPFIIKNEEIDYDFLKDINPPGVGAESTGLVTRFSVENEIKFKDFPLKIKVLTPKDILIILIDTFFLDLKKITFFINSKDLDLHIKKIESNYNNKKQTIFTEYDVLEIKEYFENHLSKHTILFEGLIETRFFERVAKIIDGYSFKEWVTIFEVLWNKNDHLSLLFSNLINGLSDLNFANIVYIKFEEVLRGNGEILDVKRLKDLNSPLKTTLIKSNDGDEIEISLALLTALTSELIFSIPKEIIETKKFLINSDLLDFPGARSRLAIELHEIEADIIPDMLLRGKVSYLFNKYSDDFNINNLLFCTNDQKNEVNEIPTLLFNWISKNIGENFHERSKSLIDSGVPPLFIIFTFFNNQLKFDSTNDTDYNLDYHKLDYKWDTRFNRFFKDEIVTQTKNWDTNWIAENDNFSNFYFLRDFKYSTDTFEGFELHGTESDIVKERISFLDKLKESFLNFDFVKNHFENPLKSWEKSTSINSDGSELIIDNLEIVSNNTAKINHNINKVLHINKEIIIELKKNIFTDNISEIRDKNMKNFNDFQATFDLLLTKDIKAFNLLIDSFTLKPIEIFKLLNENILIDTYQKTQEDLTAAKVLISRFDELKKVNSVEEVYEVLKLKLSLNSNDLVDEYLKNSAITIDQLFTKSEPLSKSKILTDLVMNYWTSKINCNRNNFEYFYDLGFNKKNINFLAEHLISLTNKRGIKHKIERILNDIISEIYLDAGVEEFLSETFCLIINEIVTHFDSNYFSEHELIEIDNLKQIHKFKYYQSIYEVDDRTIESLFNNNLNNTLDEFYKYNKWLETFRISLFVNSGFVDYDENENNLLINIIEKFNKINLK
jgi:hypothetical protein